MNEKKGVLAIDMGGTYCKAALIHSSFSYLVSPFELSSSSSEGSLESFLNLIFQIYQRVKEQGFSVETILFSFPGPFDYRTGISYSRHKFASLYGIPLKEEIAEKCSFHGDIFFEHDAIAFLKYMIYSKSIYENSIAVTLGTGLGYAVSCSTGIKRDEFLGPEYEIYDLPYLGKKMEDFFSARGLLSFYQGKKEYHSSLELFENAKKEKEALLAFSSFGKELGRALHPFLEKEKARYLFLGGQVSKSSEFFLPPLKEELKGIAILVETASFPALKGLAYDYYKKGR